MTEQLIRSFNTVGVCDPKFHYMLPVIPRLPDITDMIEGRFYFVIHSPRQSGKTTLLKSLASKINSEDRYYAIFCDLSPLGDTLDVGIAMDQAVTRINIGLQSAGVKELKRLAYAFNSEPYMVDAVGKVQSILSDLSEALDRELIVFFDEADCLQEAPLLMFLSQIKAGFNDRSGSQGSKFPRSMALIGMRDIKDYLTMVWKPSDPKGPEGSPFNVKKESLTLPDFTRDEIMALYRQRTEETGQIFEEEAIDSAWRWSEGQPWLVNALAYEATVRQLENDRSATVTGDCIDRAARAMLLRDEAHFGSLKNRLREPRVRMVMEAVLFAPTFLADDFPDEDLSYAVDLGLLKSDSADGGSLRPANPIYRELTIRTMTDWLRKKMPQDLPGKWMDGISLDMDGLLKAFQTLWRENSVSLAEAYRLDFQVQESVALALEKFSPIDVQSVDNSIIENIRIRKAAKYNEIFAQLVLISYLDRASNGGADVFREYPPGNGRVDICVIYQGKKYLIGIKIKGVQNMDESLRQLHGYMDRAESSVGWLVVFDPDFKKPWKDKILWDSKPYGSKTIRTVGC
ncbi:MAG: hypothetical protein LBR80_09105 [Deltaproteobacteria bacterium]|jgi:hypothetical protein|nr:hypothetical protein [Deltaproteobacteria bacterium]